MDRAIPVHRYWALSLIASLTLIIAHDVAIIVHNALNSIYEVRK
jgi:hypothetical protein